MVVKFTVHVIRKMTVVSATGRAAQSQSILGLPQRAWRLEFATMRGSARSLAWFCSSRRKKAGDSSDGASAGSDDHAVPGWPPEWWRSGGTRMPRNIYEVVVPGRLIRGAWQSPDGLRAIIAREHIKTIVTLTAINRDDPKYVGQAKVVSETGVRWLFVPMRGSTATVEQMAQAADLLADPECQPVFFHCVAGHHRSSLAHAAYLIRHCGWSAAAAWKEVASLPWARPAATADQNDRALIDEFATDPGVDDAGGLAAHDRGSR